MTYTGHKNRKMPDGKTLVEWITPTVEDEAQRFNVAVPSPKQMALVISALRMHSIIMHAAGYDKSRYPHENEVTDFYPTETSIGRYFRDAARITLEEEI